MSDVRNLIGNDRLVGAMRWRKGLIVVMIVLGIVGLAWFDGGEEPIRPIEQEITVPEAS